LQADLIDFSKNGTDSTHHYGLLVSDVYSRMAYTKPLESKGSEEVTHAMNEIMSEVPNRGGRKALMTTDSGGEFAGVDSVKGLAHQTKAVGDRNAIAVVDRTMQTLKKDLAGQVALKGGSRAGTTWLTSPKPSTSALSRWFMGHPPSSSAIPTRPRIS
jgi:hypothetical protein